MRKGVPVAHGVGEMELGGGLVLGVHGLDVAVNVGAQLVEELVRLLVVALLEAGELLLGRGGLRRLCGGGGGGGLRGGRGLLLLALQTNVLLDGGQPGGNVGRVVGGDSGPLDVVKEVRGGVPLSLSVNGGMGMHGRGGHVANGGVRGHQGHLDLRLRVPVVGVLVAACVGGVLHVPLLLLLLLVGMLHVGLGVGVVGLLVVVGVGLDVLLEILGPLERLGAEVALVGLEGHVHSDVRSNVISLDGHNATVVPVADQRQVVGALSADVGVTQMGVELLGAAKGLATGSPLADQVLAVGTRPHSVGRALRPRGCDFASGVLLVRRLVSGGVGSGVCGRGRDRAHVALAGVRGPVVGRDGRKQHVDRVASDVHVGGVVRGRNGAVGRSRVKGLVCGSRGGCRELGLLGLLCWLALGQVGVRSHDMCVCVVVV